MRGGISFRRATASAVQGARADDTTDNRATIQAALDAGGRIVLPPTTGRYAISGPLNVTVPGTEIICTGAPIRQTQAPETIFNVIAPGCLIDGLDATGTDGSPDFTGMTAAWEGSSTATRWCAVNVYDTAHRLRIPWIRGRGMSSAVRIGAWTHATNAASTVPVDDITIGTVLADRVEFGLVAAGTRRLHVASVRGRYGNTTTAPRPPHLLYIDQNGPGNTGLVVGEAVATDGLGGQAFQFKGVRTGIVGRLEATNCLGVLNIMDCDDLHIEEVLSTGDTCISAYGSLSLDATTALTRTRIGRVTIRMASDGPAVRAIANTDTVISELYVEANHTTRGTATQFDVELRGTRMRLEAVTVVNVGARAWKQIGTFSGDGHFIRVRRLEGAWVGIDTRSSTNVRVEYDPATITLHGTDGLCAAYATVTASPTGCRWLSPAVSRHYGDPRLLILDTFEVQSGSSQVGVTPTGHPWTAHVGTWLIDTTRRAHVSAAVLNPIATLDAATADVEIHAGVKFAAAEGLALRYVDTSNYLYARLTTSAVDLVSRVAGVETVLGTYAATHVAGRHYQLGVKVQGDAIKVFEDGVLVISHTLSAGNQTTFGAATRHGIRANNSAAGRFDTLRILSAT